MMSDLTVVPDAIRGYGDVCATMATGVATAGSVDQAATIAAVVPVFGLIGQDFLAAFAYAQGNHLFSVGQLAAVHAASSANSFASAATYEATDGASGAGITSVATAL